MIVPVKSERRIPVKSERRMPQSIFPLVSVQFCGVSSDFRSLRRIPAFAKVVPKSIAAAKVAVAIVFLKFFIFLLLSLFKFLKLSASLCHLLVQPACHSFSSCLITVK